MTAEQYQIVIKDFKDYITKLYTVSRDAYMGQSTAPDQAYLNNPKTLEDVRRQLGQYFATIASDQTLLQQNKVVINKHLNDLITVLHNHIVYDQHPQFKSFLDTSFKKLYQGMGSPGSLTFPKGQTVTPPRSGSPNTPPRIKPTW